MAENSSTKLQDKIYFYKNVGSKPEEIIIAYPECIIVSAASKRSAVAYLLY